MKKLPKLTTAILLSAAFLALCVVFQDDDGTIAQSLHNANAPKNSKKQGIIAQNTAPKQHKETPLKPVKHEQVSPADAGTTATENAEHALRLLREIQHRLASYSSISADIHEVIQSGDHRYQADGRYLQGTQMRLRLELSIQAGRSTGQLTQICDGQLLWTETAFGPIPDDIEEEDLARYHQVTRRNVQKILQEAYRVGNRAQAFLAAELGFGGLPALMAAMDRAFEFRLLKRETIGSDNCFVLEGNWNAKTMETWNFLKKKRESIARLSVPDSVRLYVHPGLLIPRRIVYLKTGADKARKPLLVIDYENISVDEPTDYAAFQYTPPNDVFSTDTTHKYIKKLQTLRDAPE